MRPVSAVLHPAAGGRALVEIPVSWLLDDAPYFTLTGQRGPAGRGRCCRAGSPSSQGITEMRALTNFTFHRRSSENFCTGLPARAPHVRHTPRVWIATLGEISAHHRNHCEGLTPWRPFSAGGRLAKVGCYLGHEPVEGPVVIGGEQEGGD